ncbi:MAG: beta-ketoacyl synthase chain length factor [Piscinibacter sp.]|uniref:beta-ketoacyl synthase chain length factor n=1 Tax=Piscinibacter TaxID=1114981 RepID=UPI000FDF05A8|nr:MULTISPECIES: beta-ketoacyl synthase chain length factor [Piscinibacter]MCW5664885.1 beta-ketoacyl synthase chain length factor [Piscinibacter sp.]
MSLSFGLLGIGLLGPGLDDWAQAAPLLAQPAAWAPRPTVVPAPARLPATERRRAGPLVKASVALADQACQAAGRDPAGLPSVFTSSTGEPGNCHALCEALAAPERLVSPTRFTNSVHNAAGGYWHIATRSMQDSTSLGAFDASFAAGLLEAAAICAERGTPVLLVACDVPYPEPLHAVRPLPDSFGVALVLGPPRAGAAQLTLGALSDQPATPCDTAPLEALRRAIPAARALPLLQALARRHAGLLQLDWPPDQSIALELAFR